MSGDEHLEDGWGADTPDDDTLLRQYVLAFADRSEHDAASMGKPFGRNEVGVMARADVAFPFANPIALTRPVQHDEWPPLLAEAKAFYGSTPFAIWSAWPTPDLRSHGLILGGHPPFMVRPAVPRTMPRPDELEVERVHDDESMHTFVETFATCYPIDELRGQAPDAWLDGRAVCDDVHVYLGIVDGRPVATALAAVMHGVNLVEAISLHPDMRGRRLGEAITWEATLTDPTLPAVLISSDLGRPAYERMGYLKISRFTLWMGMGDG